MISIVAADFSLFFVIEMIDAARAHVQPCPNRCGTLGRDSLGDYSC
jgi:hypothetical protein